MRLHHKYTSIYMLDLFVSFFSVFLSLNTIIDSTWYKISKAIIIFACVSYFVIAFICFIVFKIKGLDNNALHNFYNKFRKYFIGSIIVLLIIMMFIFCIGRTFPDNTEVTI